jgi:hypothetical protein
MPVLSTGLRADSYNGSPLARISAMRSLTVILLLAIATSCRTNESPEQQVKDSAIALNIKAKLAEELGAATLANISVNVTNGVATLAGTVHDSTEKSKAVAIAKAVPDVVSVNDNLQIPSAPAGGQAVKLSEPLFALRSLEVRPIAAG